MRRLTRVVFPEPLQPASPMMRMIAFALFDHEGIPLAEESRIIIQGWKDRVRERNVRKLAFFRTAVEVDSGCGS